MQVTRQSRRKTMRAQATPQQRKNVQPMSAEVITAAISLIGTLVGTLGGIALSSNLTNYRIEQLEKKVEKHNNLITRTYKLEQEFAVMDEKVKVANHRIDDLEDLEHES